MKTTSILQMTVRILGVILLILGIVFWTGNAHFLVTFHILLGSVLTLALFVLTYQAYCAGVSKWLVLIAAVWAIGLPIWGLAQHQIFPGEYNWITKALHLLCGVGAIGVGEISAVQIRKKTL
jgi:hypothetical protein